MLWLPSFFFQRLFSSQGSHDHFDAELCNHRCKLQLSNPCFCSCQLNPSFHFLACCYLRVRLCYYAICFCSIRRNQLSLIFASYSCFSIFFF
ncbi:hypothetical protein Goari_026152 [Gossypium aridum]|uniref:Uncharacterized protein n=1 Tax=Gossypium aridum TaxID=34290 RepID=A0A7J8XBN1_GOSAI|nr:hypothetical protein [Gossypium aridum]